MIDLYNLSIEELEAIAKTQEWLLLLLSDPDIETKRKYLINLHEIIYIQDHYTDEGRLHSWANNDCGARQMYSKHPWPDAIYAKYSPHWASNEVVEITINGPYWIDIWVAASKCIDAYHVKYGKDDYTFIEGVSSDHNGNVHISTGS